MANAQIDKPSKGTVKAALLWLASLVLGKKQ